MSDSSHRHTHTHTHTHSPSARGLGHHLTWRGWAACPSPSWCTHPAGCVSCCTSAGCVPPLASSCLSRWTAWLCGAQQHRYIIHSSALASPASSPRRPCDQARVVVGARPHSAKIAGSVCVLRPFCYSRQQRVRLQQREGTGDATARGGACAPYGCSTSAGRAHSPRRDPTAAQGSGNTPLRSSDVDASHGSNSSIQERRACAR